nr:hypothetical protein BaRGS_007386 [Batillaria attramentaria]
MLFGTLGNVLIVVVMRRMRGDHMPVLFTALALSDLIIIYTGLLRRYIEYTFAFEIRHIHDLVCRLHMFVVYLCSTTSAWFLVAMTMLRVTSIMFPHSGALLHTQKGAYVIVFVIVMASSLFCAPFLFGFTLHDSLDLGCLFYNDESLIYYFLEVYPWAETFIMSLIPFCIIVITNSILGWKVVRSVRVARDIVTSARPDHVSSREKHASSLFATLVTVSVAFLCLTSPVCIFKIIYHSGILGRTAEELDAEWAVCHLLWYSNSAVNFYLYCLTGTRFREELRKLFSCHKSGESREISAPRPALPASLDAHTKGSNASEEGVSD